MNNFYQELPKQHDFDHMAEESSHVPLLAKSSIGVADIVGSTEEVKAGSYKMVNTVGAAVISAQVNSAWNVQDFPFIFGGDGARGGYTLAAEALKQEH